MHPVFPPRLLRCSLDLVSDWSFFVSWQPNVLSWLGGVFSWLTGVSSQLGEVSSGDAMCEMQKSEDAQHALWNLAQHRRTLFYSILNKKRLMKYRIWQIWLSSVLWLVTQQPLMCMSAVRSGCHAR